MDAPAVLKKEGKYTIEYRTNLFSDNKEALLKTDIVGDDVSLTVSPFQTTRASLNESITSPSRQMFIINKLMEVKDVYEDLNFKNENVIKTSFEIIQRCTLNFMTDIVISKTSQDEILIYRKDNDKFLNLLIDEDGDISFVRIGKKMEDKKIEFFSSEEKIDFNKIVSMLQY